MSARSPIPTTPVSSLTSADRPAGAEADCLMGFERSYAVLIGIDEYAKPVPRLTTPVRDVEEVGSVLSTHHGFSTTLLRNDEATASELAKTLSDLAKRVDTNDRVLLYFAGHGVVDPNSPGAGGPRGYLFPHGADRTDPGTLLAMDTFYKLVLALQCRHMLVVLDCCFSGAFRWAGMRSFVPAPAKLDTQRLEWFVRYPAWQVLASSAHDQTAADLAAGRTFGNRGPCEKHSPFAAAFISGLKGDADAGTADAGPDGIITATELFLHTERSLFASVGARQRPQLWHLEKQKYGEFIFRTPKRDLNVPPPPDLNADTNPWRGFKSYEPEDRDIFFGRGGVSEQLLEKCLAKPVTIVSGASGSGKSSLVRAGLVWRAQALGLSCTIMRPGSDPYSGLAAALASFTAGGAAAPDAATLARDRDSLKNWLHRRSGPPLLLVIDQAEELVTQWMPRSNTIDRQNAIADFLSLLAGALDARSTQRGALTFDNAERAGDAIKARGWIPLETPVKNAETIWSARAQRNDQVETIDLLAPVYKLRVVATVREEFASSLNGFAIAQWRPSLFAVPRLEQDDLRRIILGPAAAKAMRFESEQLVDDLVNDVVGMPGSLPLLSLALSEMYRQYLNHPDRMTDRTLRAKYYNITQNGIAGIVRTVADGLLAKHRDADGGHVTARRVLERFVSIDNGSLTRRQVPKAEFEFLDAGETKRAKCLLKDFEASFLIVSGGADDATYYEFAHDALIRQWKDFAGWIEKDRQRIVDLRQLTLDAEEWRPVSSDRAVETQALLVRWRRVVAEGWRARSGEALAREGRFWSTRCGPPDSRRDLERRTRGPALEFWGAPAKRARVAQRADSRPQQARARLRRGQSRAMAAPHGGGRRLWGCAHWLTILGVEIGAAARPGRQAFQRQPGGALLDGTAAEQPWNGGRLLRRATLGIARHRRSIAAVDPAAGHAHDKGAFHLQS